MHPLLLTMIPIRQKSCSEELSRIKEERKKGKRGEKFVVT
jgi:hypothetical protein